MANASSIRTIRLPEEYSSWCGLPVVLVRGLHDRVEVYTEDTFVDVSNKMREKLERDGQDYSRFYSFLRDGAHGTTIGNAGEIDLPPYLLTHIGSLDDIDIRRNTFGLEIGRFSHDDLTAPSDR